MHSLCQYSRVQHLGNDLLKLSLRGGSPAATRQELSTVLSKAVHQILSIPLVGVGRSVGRCQAKPVGKAVGILRKE